MKKGLLYVVATPLGNLDDISRRAVEILRDADVIAAEDTRHSGVLLNHYAVSTPCIAVHEHNEQQVMASLLTRLQQGEIIALVSDAGTPLISDPGFHLVRAARQAGIAVVPVPGPSALICALSVSGLPTDRFVFEGFLPARSGQRRRSLQLLSGETRTLIFYEAPHRIMKTLQDMAAIFGADRQAVIAREMTKRFETVYSGTLAGLHTQLDSGPEHIKGEFVILVHGAREQEHAGDSRLEPVLAILLDELPLKQAVSLAARITGARKNEAYEMALDIEKRGKRKETREK